jgi:hypothetical protein
MSQPQTQDVSNAEESYAVNAQWCQGIGPGFWPTKGSGLTLNIAAGTSFNGNTRFSYAGGTLSMTDNTTNYVFLDTTASNAPAKNTTGYPSTGVPIATVVTASGQITTITDDRMSFWFQAISTTNPYAITFDMGGGRVTPPATSESLLRHIIGGGLTNVSFASGLSGSYARARTASAGTYTITINKIVSGVTTSIGTITFSTSATGSFTFSSTVTLSPGDVVEFVSGTADASIVGIHITMQGTRT